MKSLQYLLDKK